MSKSLVRITVAILLLVGRAPAGTFFGALSNFDAVNDTLSPCNGFEIELDDIQSKDVTFTFDFQRYGTPKITEDTSLGVAHPRTFVRWMSPYDQVNHVFTLTTPVAAPNFQNTGGHLCYRGMLVGSIPYDTAGCEHFGVGTLKNPSATVYRWMKEDPTTPGTLIAQGNPVTIPAPVWTVGAGPAPVVQAVIPVPPPPAVVPVPYLPDREFGVAVWVKVFETESSEHADLERLVADDVAVPGNLGPVPNPDAVPEIEWQILQTDAMNPSVNELTSSRQIGNGKESVTRRYEFYKYVGPYEINTSDGANTGTNEALCASVGADSIHGGAGIVTVYDANGTPSEIDCSSTRVVGDYIGAQNAAVNIATPLSANGSNLVDGEVGVRYPDRPLIFGGGGGPYSITFSGGTLPATDPGNEFTLASLTGVLTGGIPNGTGTATFTVHATDLTEPAQPAVDATFNITVVAAVSVDSDVIPDGAANETTTANLTASGGETPFNWTAVAVSAGLQASLVGNTLSLIANASGAFDVQVTVVDSLGGTDTKTLTYHVSGVGVATSTPTATVLTPTATPTATALSPTPTLTNTAVATTTPSNTVVASSTPTQTLVPIDTPTTTPAVTATSPSTATATLAATPSVTSSPTSTMTSAPSASVTPTTTRPPLPTSTISPTALSSATPSATRTATSAGAVTPAQVTEEGCQISARSGRGVPWAVLIPLALLAWRRSRPR